MRRVFTIAGVIVLAAACAGGIRPSYSPMPEALSDTVTAAPGAVVEAIVTQLAAEGMRIEWQSAAEGYVQTQWFDLVSRQSGTFDRGRIEQFVRLRFFVDPVGTDRAAIFAEAVSLRGVDPSRLERDLELMLPRGHAGHEIVSRVMRQVAQSFGG